MIEVAAITSGRDLPSTRYRIRQHIHPLEKLGVNVVEHCPAIDKWAAVPGKPRRWSNKQVLPFYIAWQGTKLLTRFPGIVKSHLAGVTWLNKELLPGYSTLESLLSRPLVADIDDALWLTPPFGSRVARKLAQRADVLVVGNGYLADWFGVHNANIQIIPTAIDTELFYPDRAGKGGEGCFTVGWIGSQGNLAYLQSIEDALVVFLKQYTDARLLVVSDRAPSFQKLTSDQVMFKPWQGSEEVADIQSMDVGLMPLQDSEWARGKCAFKMLQYMALEKPVVVSPVGMNRQVLEMDSVGFAARSKAEWIEALVYLYENREEGRLLGKKGRVTVKKEFSVTVVSQKLASMFHSL